MVQRALLVGIDQYPDPRNNLNSCIADTLAFRDILMAAYGVPQGDITLLHNQAATLDNVRSALDALLNGVRDGEKVVYFESSHGYRYPKGDTMVEVLCLYDAFLEDTELVNRSQAAPGDCLTVITDSCHSGGLNKLFFPPTGTSVARAKVWQPPEDRAAIDVATSRQVSAFKFFGRAATSEVGAVAKEFSESSITNKDFVPQLRTSVPASSSLTACSSPPAGLTRRRPPAALPPTTCRRSPTGCSRNSMPAAARLRSGR